MCQYVNLHKYHRQCSVENMYYTRAHIKFPYLPSQTNLFDWDVFSEENNTTKDIESQKRKQGY